MALTGYGSTNPYAQQPATRTVTPTDQVGGQRFGHGTNLNDITTHPISTVGVSGGNLSLGLPGQGYDVSGDTRNNVDNPLNNYTPGALLAKQPSAPSPSAAPQAPWAGPGAPWSAGNGGAYQGYNPDKTVGRLAQLYGGSGGGGGGGIGGDSALWPLNPNYRAGPQLASGAQNPDQDLQALRQAIAPNQGGI